MIAVKCDRCGKDIKSVERSLGRIPGDIWPGETILEVNHIAVRADFCADFCAPCAQAVADFLSRPPARCAE